METTGSHKSMISDDRLATISIVNSVARARRASPPKQSLESSVALARGSASRQQLQAERCCACSGHTPHPRRHAVAALVPLVDRSPLWAIREAPPSFGGRLQLGYSRFHDEHPSRSQNRECRLCGREDPSIRSSPSRKTPPKRQRSSRRRGVTSRTASTSDTLFVNGSPPLYFGAQP